MTPDWTVAPGETLRECLEEREMSQVGLARSMGISAKHLNQIIKGRVSISPAIAVKLERALGIQALLWLRLDAAYQLDLYRQQQSVHCEPST